MKIEKNIPFPLTQAREVAKKMEFGDSVLFKGRDDARQLREAIQEQGSIAVSRTVPEGLRLWKQKPQTEIDGGEEA